MVVDGGAPLVAKGVRDKLCKSLRGYLEKYSGAKGFPRQLSESHERLRDLLRQPRCFFSTVCDLGNLVDV